MLEKFSPEEIPYLATTFAIAVSEGLDYKSTRVLCSFFANVVATLNLITNQRFLLEKPPCDKAK
ncbi:MAG: hypothetical protein LKJ45_04025 [Oscillospiraceae bacterium]|jgi:hypothetical protein|nr:hypothetical protein [Oscillospiraceae bacterium]